MGGILLGGNVVRWLPLLQTAGKGLEPIQTPCNDHTLHAMTTPARSVEGTDISSGTAGDPSSASATLSCLPLCPGCVNPSRPSRPHTLSPTQPQQQHTRIDANRVRILHPPKVSGGATTAAAAAPTKAGEARPLALALADERGLLMLLPPFAAAVTARVIQIARSVPPCARIGKFNPKI